MVCYTHAYIVRHTMYVVHRRTMYVESSICVYASIYVVYWCIRTYRSRHVHAYARAQWCMLKYGAITYMYSVHCTLYCTLYGVHTYIYCIHTHTGVLAHTHTHTHIYTHTHPHMHIHTRTYTHNHGVLYNRFDVESTSESMNRK